MVTRALFFLLAALCGVGCLNQPSELRAARDAEIGLLDTETFRLEAIEGLAHVRSHGDGEVVLRASAAELAFRLARKTSTLESVRLTLWNLPPTFQLEATPSDVLTQGASDSRFPLSATFTVRFPDGVNEISFATPPRAPRPFTFLAFGDIQNGIADFGEVVAAVNTEPDAEFVLMLGDLSIRAREEEFDAVEAAYSNLRFPVYATIGNHDVDETLRYQERFGRASYSFLHRGVRFSSIDSASADISPETLAAFEGWASAASAAGGNEDALHVAFSHIPALDVFGVRSGQWNSRRRAHRFLAVAAEHDLDLLLYGHIHSHDAYEIGGIPTHISGGCGAFEEQLDGIGRHYLRVRADPLQGTLDVEVVRVDP